MRIMVMGAGALGGYFGARLAAAGHDVTFVARGAHLAAMRKDGLRVESPKGDLHLADVAATDDPSGVGPVDVILFMVKNYDLEAAAEAARPALGPETAVVTCQNGVTAPDRLAALLGAERVLPGVAIIPGEVAAPGVIRHSAEFDILRFGERDGPPSARCRAFARALEEAGCTPELQDNILHELWAKFISQSALSSMTALTRLDIGPIRRAPAARRLFFDAMQEAERVGRAAVPDLPEGFPDRQWGILEGMPDTMHASMLDDLNRGKRLEVDYLSGDVVKLGRRHGVATPIHAVFWAALAPYADGPPA